MKPKPTGDRSQREQSIPADSSLHELLLTPGFAALLETHSRDSATSAARTVLARLKQEIAEGHHTQASLESELALLHVTVAGEIAQGARYSLRRVINATGVVLHTNLGGLR